MLIFIWSLIRWIALINRKAQLARDSFHSGKPRHYQAYEDNSSNAVLRLQLRKHTKYALTVFWALKKGRPMQDWSALLPLRKISTTASSWQGGETLRSRRCPCQTDSRTPKQSSFASPRWRGAAAYTRTNTHKRTHVRAQILTQYHASVTLSHGCMRAQTKFHNQCQLCQSTSSTLLMTSAMFKLLSNVI